MLRPVVVVLTLALYCFSGFRMSVDATPLPLPMPLALMAPDFSSRWHLRNDTASFNLARGLVSHGSFNASADYHSGFATSHGHSSLTRRKYTDKLAQLYGYYSTAQDSSSNLSRFSPLYTCHGRCLTPAFREVRGAVGYCGRERSGLSARRCF